MSPDQHNDPQWVFFSPWFLGPVVFGSIEIRENRPFFGENGPVIINGKGKIDLFLGIFLVHVLGCERICS